MKVIAQQVVRIVESTDCHHPGQFFPALEDILDFLRRFGPAGDSEADRLCVRRDEVALRSLIKREFDDIMAALGLPMLDRLADGFGRETILAILI